MAQKKVMTLRERIEKNKKQLLLDFKRRVKEHIRKPADVEKVTSLNCGVLMEKDVVKHMDEHMAIMFKDEKALTPEQNEAMRRGAVWGAHYAMLYMRNHDLLQEATNGKAVHAKAA